MRVLLLEAGGADENFHYSVPAFHGEATEDEALRWDYFVRHYTDDDRSRLDPKFCEDEGGVWYPRAGTLGGCTAHNAMITISGPRADWDAIADELDDPTWSSEAMRGYFEKLERCTYVHWFQRLFGNRPPPRIPRLAHHQPPGRHGRAARSGAARRDPGGRASRAPKRGRRAELDRGLPPLPAHVA